MNFKETVFLRRPNKGDADSFITGDIMHLPKETKESQLHL